MKSRFLKKSWQKQKFGIIKAMKLLSRFLSSFISNVIALYIATYFVVGFKIIGALQDFLWVALIFTLINFFLRPIFKLILGPIIILTLGLGIILVNMLMLYILTLLTPKIVIAGLSPLVYGSLIIGFANFIFHFLAKGTKEAD